VAKNPDGTTAPLDPSLINFDESDFVGLDVSPEEQQSQLTEEFDAPPPESYYRPQADLGTSSFDFGQASGADGSSFQAGQLMGLGLSETLPPFEVMEELYVYWPGAVLFHPTLTSVRLP
jgi:hypothetical protein